MRPRIKTVPIFATLTAALLFTTGCRFPRPDDALEPNNDFQTATRLTAGQPKEGRVKENNVDIFAIDATAGQMLVFKLQHLAHEDCAAFTVTGPGDEILYRDRHGTCSRVGQPEVQKEGVLFQPLRDFGYEIRVPAQRAGTYYLTLDERPAADNVFEFSWDYRVTVEVN